MSDTPQVPTSDTSTEALESGFATSRDAIRGAFANAKPEFREVYAFGTKLHIRQPSIAAVMDSETSQDRKQQVVNMLIGYCFTINGEKLFDEADEEMLLQLPFGKDFQAIQNNMNEMLGVVVTEDTKSPVAGVTGDVDGDDSVS
jgi:hypothetical protein